MGTADTEIGARRPAGLSGSALRWLAGLTLPLGAIGVALERGTASDLPLGAVILAGWVGVGIWVMAALDSHPHRRFGAANGVTALRLAGTVVLGMLVLEAQAFGGAGQRAVGIGALLLLALDGLDGALARRFGTASRFGARFDVEVDAALTLVMGALVWQTGAAGPLAMAVAAPYYVFSAGRIICPWLRTPPPPSLLRKAVCVAQIGVLLALLILPAPRPFGDLAVVAVLAALAWSFGRDIRYLRALV